jgi:hypothetical protein
MLDMLNPMHRLWSDGRWNKLTVAHGCYWKKCSFCDVSLDYIGRYDTASAELLVDRIEAIVAETGQTGFHFVDEAAPPKMLKALADELPPRPHDLVVGQHPLREVLHPRAVPPARRQRLHRHLRRPGGGLRPPAQADEEGRLGGPGGPRHQGLLGRRHPGARLPDVRLPHADRAGHRGRARIRAPALRRRLHPVGLLPPLRVHRAFAGRPEPEDYGVRLKPLPPISFAKNDVGFIDPTGVDHDALGVALNKALYNYMHGIGLDQDVRSWFDMKVPKTRVPRNFIGRALGY